RSHEPAPFPRDHDVNEHILDGALRREPALEVLRARDVGLADRPDDEVLEFAAARGMIVVSDDVNTMPAHAYARLAAGRPVAGLLMVKQTDPIGPIIDSLLSSAPTTAACSNASLRPADPR